VSPLSCDSQPEAEKLDSLGLASQHGSLLGADLCAGTLPMSLHLCLDPANPAPPIAQICLLLLISL
jgi:hypothetical protein